MLRIFGRQRSFDFTAKTDDLNQNNVMVSVRLGSVDFKDSLLGANQIQDCFWEAVLGVMDRLVLSDAAWERMAPLIIGRPDQKGSTGRDNRMFVEGVLWIVRTGSPWRDLPEAFGDWNSVFRRFSRWSIKGVWWRIFEAMSDDPDFEYLIVDSTIVRAHQHAAGAKKGSEDQALGRSRGGLSTKIHLAVRGLGCPVRFTLTAGQKGDAPQAAALLEGCPPRSSWPTQP